MGRTPVPEPRPQQSPAPAIEHLYDGAADPAEEPDVDLTTEEPKGVCDLPETTDHRRSD
jgi:hypothetical protein